MKFKLVEKFDETRSMVQEYMYDAMDELNNASLQEYTQWFKDNLTAYPEDLEQAVTDAYIEACDYGMIKGVEKTRLTSELKEYIESHTDIIDDTHELMRQCPSHLQHELKIVLSKLDESLTEQLFESSYLSIPKNLTQFIEEHADLLDTDVDELYLLCPIGLKASLLEVLHTANIDVDKELVRKVKFLTSEYTNSDLDVLVMDNGGYLGTTTNNIEYIITNWNKFDFPKYDSLNESVLEEALRPDLKRFIEQHAKLLDENNIEELYKQCPRELKIPLVRILKAASLGDDTDIIKRATYLEDSYEDEELIDLALSVTHHVNDVFDAFDYIMNNWYEFFTDDMLNEELLTETLLTEEQVIYKVTHDLTDGSPYYLNVTENKDLTKTDKDARTKLTSILKDPKQKYGGESVNLKSIGPLLSAYSEDPDGIHMSREGTFDDVKDLLTPLNMLMLTLSTWRKQAHNDPRVKHIAKLLNIDNYTVHHLDGKEWNNDSSNFLIVPSGNVKDSDNKDFRNFIHTCLHMIKAASKSNKEQKSKSFPLYYIKDDKDVYRMYLTLQLHADKQLTNISLTSDKLN